MARKDAHELAREWQSRSLRVAEIARGYDVMDDDDAAQEARLTIQAATLKQCARELIDFLDE